jgi:hypothetical protein
VLKQRRLSPREMESFYDRVKDFPCVSNRVAPYKPEPKVQIEFRESEHLFVYAYSSRKQTV